MAVILNTRSHRDLLSDEKLARMSLARKALGTEVDRRYIYTLMPKLAADLLPGM